MFWHPSQSDLALVGSGDLYNWRRKLVERHMKRCATCAGQASEYAEVSGELFGLDSEEAGDISLRLAGRIVAAAQGYSSPRPAAFNLIPAAGMLALVLIALALLAQSPVMPRRTDNQASAGTSEAIVGEVVGPQGRQRVVIYTGSWGPVMEVSPATAAIGISRTDPMTGAVTITRISLGE